MYTSTASQSAPVSTPGSLSALRRSSLRVHGAHGGLQCQHLSEGGLASELQDLRPAVLVSLSLSNKNGIAWQALSRYLYALGYLVLLSRCLPSACCLL